MDSRQILTKDLAKSKAISFSASGIFLVVNYFVKLVFNTAYDRVNDKKSAWKS